MGRGQWGREKGSPGLGRKCKLGGGLGMSEELGFGVRLSREYGTDSLVGKGPG